MYLFSFLYPRPTTRAFDYEYHRHRHMALGVGLARRHLGITPLRFWIERIDEDDPASTQPYCAIVHLVFETEAERDRLLKLADFPEAAALLYGDYANYTDAPPEIRLATLTVDEDMEEVIRRFGAPAS